MGCYIGDSSDERGHCAAIVRRRSGCPRERELLPGIDVGLGCPESTIAGFNVLETYMEVNVDDTRGTCMPRAVLQRTFSIQHTRFISMLDALCFTLQGLVVARDSHTTHRSALCMMTSVYRSLARLTSVVVHLAAFLFLSYALCFSHSRYAHASRLERLCMEGDVLRGERGDLRGCQCVIRRQDR